MNKKMHSVGTFLTAAASSGTRFDENLLYQEKRMEKQQKQVFFSDGVSRLMDRLYGAALRFTRNPADAEDLIADALVKAWNCLDSLQDLQCFDGWLMRILSNTYISQWRRNQARAEIFDDEPCPHDLDDRDSLYAKLHHPFLLWYGTPEQKFVNDLLIEDIERSLDQLPDAYRDVVVMVEVLGMKYEEVAQELELPVGTVRSRLNRGRKMLQEALWQNARDAGIVHPHPCHEETRS